jgi:hypothetical protein
MVRMRMYFTLPTCISTVFVAVLVMELTCASAVPAIFTLLVNLI